MGILRGARLVTKFIKLMSEEAKQLTRSNWWFRNMRTAVDKAINWQAVGPVETREQEHTRLLTELHQLDALYQAARRAQQWSAMTAYAQEVARIGNLLDLGRERGSECQP